MSDQLPHDEELRALYRKLPPDEPRPEIDARILAAAREEIHDRQRRRFLSRLGWTVPLAAAASIAVTITLIRVAPEQRLAPTETVELGEGAVRKDAAPGPSPASGELPALAAAPPPPAPEAAAEAKIAEAAEQKLEGLGYVGSDDTFVSQDRAPKGELDDMQRQRAEESTPAGGSAKSADGWRPLGSGRSFETYESIIEREVRERKSASKEAREKAPAAPPPAGAPAAAPPAGAPAAAPPADAPAAAPPASAMVAPPAADSATESAAAPSMAARAPSMAAEESAATSNRAARIGDTLSKTEPAARLQAKQLEDKKEDRAPLAAWPFRLEAGLDAAESCRRIAATLQARCELSQNTATVALGKPRKIDAGEFAGSTVSRLRLIFNDGKLWKVALLIDGYKTEQVLVAPAETAK